MFLFSTAKRNRLEGLGRLNNWIMKISGHLSSGKLQEFCIFQYPHLSFLLRFET